MRVEQGTEIEHTFTTIAGGPGVPEEEYSRVRAALQRVSQELAGRPGLDPALEQLRGDIGDVLRTTRPLDAIARR